MDSTTPSSSSKSSMSVGMIAVGAVILVGIGAVVYKTRMNSSSQTSDSLSMEQSESTASSSPIAMVSYKDGTYDAVGAYTSPAGAEEIDVKLTLKGSIVTDAAVIAKATAPKSQFMQKAFIDGFKEQVIGKSIADLKLTKVSGSSLTPLGFNDALEKIKSQATM